MRSIQTLRFLSLVCSFSCAAAVKFGAFSKSPLKSSSNEKVSMYFALDSILPLADQLEVKLSPNPEYAEGFVVEISSATDMEVIHEVVNPKEFMIYRSKAKLYRSERFTGSLFLTNIEKYPYLVHRVICPDGSIHSTSIILK